MMFSFVVVEPLIPDGSVCGGPEEFEGDDRLQGKLFGAPRNVVGKQAVVPGTRPRLIERNVGTWSEDLRRAA